MPRQNRRISPTSLIALVDRHDEVRRAACPPGRAGSGSPAALRHPARCRSGPDWPRRYRSTRRGRASIRSGRRDSDRPPTTCPVSRATEKNASSIGIAGASHCSSVSAKSRSSTSRRGIAAIARCPRGCWPARRRRRTRRPSAALAASSRCWWTEGTAVPHRSQCSAIGARARQPPERRRAISRPASLRRAQGPRSASRRRHLRALRVNRIRRVDPRRVACRRCPRGAAGAGRARVLATRLLALLLLDLLTLACAGLDGPARAACLTCSWRASLQTSGLRVRLRDARPRAQRRERNEPIGVACPAAVR